MELFWYVAVNLYFYFSCCLPLRDLKGNRNLFIEDPLFLVLYFCESKCD